MEGTVTDSLEAEIDLLFQLPPAEVVPARKALADTLKQAGDRASATRVMAIKRPPPAAWAINQVHFREPELLERARAGAAKLRELTAADGVDGRQLSAAVEAQRGATQAVVDAAARHCDAAGLAGGAPQQRKIFTSIQGWLSGTADEQPGRMTHDLEASGFDAIGSVGLVLAQPVPPPAAASGGGASGAGRPSHGAAAGVVRLATSQRAPARTPEPAQTRPPEPDPRELARATEQLAKSEREARTAVERARARETEQKQAERELERARLQVKDAERALVHLRAAVAKREAEHAQARAAVDDAAETRTRTERAVAHARAELASLRGHRSSSK
jgi:hypothetical protein